MKKRAIDYEKAWPGLTIRHLVIATNEFIVFVDNDFDLDWQTSDEFDERGRRDPVEHHAVMNLVALLESTPCAHLSDSTRLSFKRLLGEAVARSLSDDYGSAREMLNLARKYISERNVEKARFWQIRASGLTVVVSMLVGGIAWLARQPLAEELGTPALHVLFGACAGALGALLSLSFRVGKERMDASSGWLLISIEGVLRVVAGMVSAVLVSLCVLAGIVLPVISGSERELAGMLVMGLVAGASERLAPSIVARLDGGASVMGGASVASTTTDHGSTAIEG